MSVSDVTDHSEVINIQDYVTQVGQGAIADRPRETLGTSDAAIVLLRSIWQREISAMPGRRLLKEWRIPEDISATVGL